MWMCHLSIYSQFPNLSLFCFVLLGLCPPNIFCLLAQYPAYQERTLKGCCRRKELLILVLVCVLFSCFCSGGGAAAPPGRVLPSKCTGPPANFPVSLQATFQQGSLAAQWVPSKLLLLTPSPLQPWASVANGGSQPHPLQQSIPILQRNLFQMCSLLGSLPRNGCFYSHYCCILEFSLPLVINPL